jgi:hypothetical protein
MTPAVRFLSIAVLVVAAPTVRGQTKSALPGWTMTTNMTVDSGGAGSTTSMALREQVTARHTRIEFVQVSGMSTPMSIEGMYTIFDLVDSTVITVMPAQHVASIMGLDMLERVKTPLITSEQNLTRSDLQDLGDGGQVRGHATRHYRLTTAGTMTIRVAGQACTTSMDGATDIWIAPDVDLGPAAEAANKQLGAIGGVSAAPNRGVTPAPMPKGTALKSIWKRTGSDATGKPITVTTTTEVVEFAHANLDPSVFTLPAEIQPMDMRKLLAELPPGALDSAMSSNGAGDKAGAMKCAGG